MKKKVFGMRRTLLALSVALCMLLAIVLSGCESSEPITFQYVEFPTLDSTCYAIQGMTGAVENFQIPAEHNGKPVIFILDEAFAMRKMSSVSMESVLYIQNHAFHYCTKLKYLDLGSVEKIGTLAFGRCIALEYVIIPASCKRIEEAAFSGCDSLKAVYFKGVPEEIDPSAFDQGVTIYGQEGSYIEDYALENKFTFVQWGDSAKSN